MQLENTKNIVTKGFTCLVYGEAGTGKTFDIQKIPNPLVLNVEAGLLSLQGLDIPYIEIPDWKTFLEVLAIILKEPEYADKFICIDSLTSLAELCYKHYLKASPNDNRYAYGKLGDSFVAIIEKLQRCGRNIYLVAQQTKQESENGVIKYFPLFKGNYASSRIPYIVDFIFAKRLILDKEGKPKRVMQVVKDNQFEIKSRIPLKKDFYSDITEIYNEIFNYNHENQK